MRRPGGLPTATAGAGAAAAVAASPDSTGRGAGDVDTGVDGDSRGAPRDLNAALVAALVEQFQRESLPWILDLVEPLLQGPPQPLTGTVSPERLADPDSRFVTVNGIRIHYKMSLPGEKESGGPAASAATAAALAGASGLPSSRSAPALAGAPNPDAAPTLLLMHGLNGSTFNWRLLMDDLAAYVSPSTGGCRVIAYDRPPYGLSERPRQWPTEEDNPYTLVGGARLASSLLDALTGRPSAGSATTTATAAARVAAWGTGSSAYRLGAGPPSRAAGARPAAVLVGHSAGAAVAVELALRHPDKVGGLVLIAPAISTDERGFLARADLGQLLRLAWTRALLSVDGPGINYVRRQVLKRRAEVEGGQLGIYADEREVPQEVIDGYLRPLRAADWDWGTLLAYRAFQVSGAPPALEQLRVPVLVIQGRQDRTVPMEAVQRLVDVLRRRQGRGCVTEMVVLEQCAHVPMDEQPLGVLQAIVDFTNRHCCDPRPPLDRSLTADPASPTSSSSPREPALAPGVTQGTEMARHFGLGRGPPR